MTSSDINILQQKAVCIHLTAQEMVMIHNKNKIKFGSLVRSDEYISYLVDTFLH